MKHSEYSDEYIKDILDSVKNIAVVGASPRPERPSHGVMKILISAGYNVFPVNPEATGTTILGKKVYANLKEIDHPIDMVDVFRRPEMVAPIVDDAIAVKAKVLWMQLGVVNEVAAAKAEQAGMKVVMNRCPSIELGRFRGKKAAHFK